MLRTSTGLFEGGVEYMGLSWNWGVPSKPCGGSHGACTEVAAGDDKQGRIHR